MEIDSPPDERKWLSYATKQALWTSPDYFAELNFWIAAQQTPEKRLTFSFADEQVAYTTTIPVSRLVFVGGPFRALAEGNFLEAHTGVVKLSSEDNPETFAMLRNFLYSCPIRMDTCDFDGIVRLAKAADRWQLVPLLIAVCNYLADSQMLAIEPVRLIKCADIVTIPGTPISFLDYYWSRIAISFDTFCNPYPWQASREVTDVRESTSASGGPMACRFSPDLFGPKAEENEEEFKARALAKALCHEFPRLWEMALEQKVIQYLLPEIGAHSNRLSYSDLLHLAIYFFEPLMEDDGHVQNMFQLLEATQTLREHPNSIQNASGRALTLLQDVALVNPAPTWVLKESWIVRLKNPGKQVYDFMLGSSRFSTKFAEEDAGLGDLDGIRISVAVDVVVNQVLPGLSWMTISVDWDLGTNFPERNMDIRIVLELWSDTCSDSECNCWREFMFGRIEVQEPVRACRSGPYSRCVGFLAKADILEGQNREFRLCESCTPRLKLSVRLLDSLSATVAALKEKEIQS